MSNDSTVARCSEGMSPFTYAWRIGSVAAPLRPHRTSSPTATQNAVVRPSRASSATSTSRPASRAEVRRRNSSRIRGAAMPPAISAPAMMAAASPAML